MLTVAVMAILITAPLGAILIMLTGPRLLARDVPEEVEEVHHGHWSPGGEHGLRLQQVVAVMLCSVLLSRLRVGD